MLTELWGIRDGLNLAFQLEITHLEVETDSTTAISLIKNKPPNSHPYSSMINDCRLMMTTFSGIRMDHAYREANFCAYLMAKKGEHLIFWIWSMLEM